MCVCANTHHFCTKASCGEFHESSFYMYVLTFMCHNDKILLLIGICICGSNFHNFIPVAKLDYLKFLHLRYIVSIYCTCTCTVDLETFMSKIFRGNTFCILKFACVKGTHKNFYMTSCVLYEYSNGERS